MGRIKQWLFEAVTFVLFVFVIGCGALAFLYFAFEGSARPFGG